MSFIPFVLSAIFAAAGASPGTLPSSRVEETGRIERVDVHSISNDLVSAWVRVRLVSAATGPRQSFSGSVSLAGVALPLKTPVPVMVQPGASGLDAVFMIEVELSRVQSASLGGLSEELVPLAIEGTLSGDKGSRSRVRASGRLPVGKDGISAKQAVASEMIRFTGARLAGLSLSDTRGEATLELFNPLADAVAVEEIRYVLHVDGRPVAQGGRDKVLLHPRRANALVLPIEGKNSDLLAAAGHAAAQGGTVQGRLTGHVTVRAGKGRKVISIDLPGNVSLLK